MPTCHFMTCIVWHILLCSVWSSEFPYKQTGKGSELLPFYMQVIKLTQVTQPIWFTVHIQFERPPAGGGVLTAVPILSVL